MNRRGTFSLTVLILFCITVSQIPLSFASHYPPAKIGTSGTIIKNVVEHTPISVVEQTRIKKHVVAYALESPSSEEVIRQLAQFDLVDISRETSPYVARIKAVNPNVIVIAYRSIMAMHTYYDDWPEADAHEDWFLHDVNGNRIRAVGGLLASWYGMDVGNPGWREHIANYVKRMLENYPDLDGIFADNTWDSFRYEVWNVPKEQLPADIGSRWHNDMLGMISFVKKTIGNKLLILNTENNDDYVDACDGKMDEVFIHPHWWSLDEFHDEWVDWKGKVESLKDVSQRGKYYLAQSGAIIPENPTEAELNKVHDVIMYCLSSYLLGIMGGKATFGFNSIHSKDGSRGYYSEFDVSLGSPVNEYYPVDAVYARDFADGKVIVNPTRSSYTVNLSSEYKTPDGQTVSNVTLDAHSGIILLRS